MATKRAAKTATKHTAKKAAAKSTAAKSTDSKKRAPTKRAAKTPRGVTPAGKRGTHRHDHDNPQAAKSMPKAGRDPEGGLTAAGRAYFRKKEGAHLRPGVQGPADTPEKMVRKGSFLRRHFTHPRGPMKDDQGRPTRLALSAHAWGEPVPATMGDAKKLAAKGHQLLVQYHEVEAAEKAVAKPGARKRPAKKSTVSRASAKAATKAARAAGSPGTSPRKAAAGRGPGQRSAAKKKTKRVERQP